MVANVGLRSSSSTTAKVTGHWYLLITVPGISLSIVKSAASSSQMALSSYRPPVLFSRPSAASRSLRPRSQPRVRQGGLFSIADIFLSVEQNTRVGLRRLLSFFETVNFLFPVTLFHNSSHYNIQPRYGLTKSYEILLKRPICRFESNDRSVRYGWFI